MEHNTFARTATIDDLERLTHAGHLSEVGLERAYTLIGKTADTARWVAFLDKGLLALGVVFSLAGAIFLIAYNWAGMHHLLKLGLVLIVLLALVVVTTWRGLTSLVGKAALLGAAILVGGLFAVFGQAYQTGADSFQLFLTWVLLILPWAIVNRWTPLWLLVLALANLSLFFFWQQRLFYDTQLLYIVQGMLNVAWLCAWEYGAEKIGWMRRWLAQVAGALSCGLLLFPTLIWVIDWTGPTDGFGLLAAAIYAALCVCMFGFYRRMHDLLMLSIYALSLVIVITAGGIRFLIINTSVQSGNFLLLSLLVIIATSIAVALLRQTARSWERMPL